ncbi:MAG: acetylglutamate kinase [Candidatus Firestonebacteria bacterium]
MEKLIEKAKVLIEALPYIKKFYGKTVVVKYGGKAMESSALKESIVIDIIFMKYVGMNPIIVHGGGPEISSFMEKLGNKPKFVNGFRVTDKNTMNIVEMVLVGKINKEIVNLINKNGGKAVGISGKDGNLIFVEKKKSKIDLGFVGEVKKINTEILNTLDGKGFIPVIAPLGTDKNNDTYNINADSAASEIAIALKAEKLVFLTDVRGILPSKNKFAIPISTLTVKDAVKLKKKNIIDGGMLPKVDACIKALQYGIKKTHIIDGRIMHALLLEIFTDKGIGTEIVK